MFKQPYHDWEMKHELINNKQVDGFKYWNYMRRDMFMSFKDEYGNIEPPFYKNMKEGSGGNKKLEKIKKLVLPIEQDRVVKSDYLFLCHPRRQEIDGKMVSIYTDYIADNFPGSVTLQRSGAGKYKREDIYSKNLLFADGIREKSYVYRYFMKYTNPGKYKEIREKIKKDMEEPFRDLNEGYDLHPNTADFTERATVLYFLYKYRKKEYEKLLDKISPKVIVEVVGRSFDAEIINEMASERGIKTIELQHGTNTLWFPENIPFPQGPLWYFSFGEFWNEETRPGVPEGHMLSTGFPFHDIMMKDYPKEKRKQDKNAIIFLSGVKYGKELFEAAAGLKKLRPELDVIFKLHPMEYDIYMEKYPGVMESGVRVIGDRKTPLYSLFAESYMQVGVESTAILEGMGFELATFIYDHPMAVAMKGILDKGYAKMFKTPEELAALTDAAKESAPAYDLNDFWKENSLETITDLIRRIHG